MTWWQTLSVSWLFVGMLFVVGAEFAERTNHPRAPAKNRFLMRVGFWAVLVLGAPLLVLFCLAVCLQMLWRGQFPFTGKAWWPARARRFSDEDSENDTRETAICQMVAIRTRIDPRLHHRRRLHKWTMSDLWNSPEGFILDAVEQYLWLRDGGMSEGVALRGIWTSPGNDVNVQSNDNLTLYSTLASALRRVDPDYLKLPKDILSEAIAIAEDWACRRIEVQKAAEPFPPASWLVNRVTTAEIENLGLAADEELKEDRLKKAPYHILTTSSFDFTFCVRSDGPDWLRLKGRMLPTDELWTFKSQPQTWEQLGGRAGVAVLRNGRPIDRLITMMN